MAALLQLGVGTSARRCCRLLLGQLLVAQRALVFLRSQQHQARVSAGDIPTRLQAAQRAYKPTQAPCQSP